MIWYLCLRFESIEWCNVWLLLCSLRGRMLCHLSWMTGCVYLGKMGVYQYWRIVHATAPAIAPGCELHKCYRHICRLVTHYMFWHVQRCYKILPLILYIQISKAETKADYCMHQDIPEDTFCCWEANGVSVQL